MALSVERSRPNQRGGPPGRYPAHCSAEFGLSSPRVRRREKRPSGPAAYGIIICDEGCVLRPESWGHRLIAQAYFGPIRSHGSIIRRQRSQLPVLTIFVHTSIIDLSMRETVQSSKSKQRAGGAEEAVFLDLLRTTDMLSRGLVQVLKVEDLSSTQYNVLRILRGAREGLACGEIANRMITRDPDVTRLLDRLEKRGLISRCRETEDRRTVRAWIAPEGLKVLARLDEPVQAAHRQQLAHLGRERRQALTELLRLSRSHVL